MKVFIFGNPDLQFDSLPINILPKLKKQFPKIDFEIKDPNEDWDIPEEIIVIDTILNIDKPAIFEDLKNFSDSPRVSLHDFDALANLKYLKKIGKIKKIKIIGLPPAISSKKALQFLIKILSNPL